MASSENENKLYPPLASADSLSPSLTGEKTPSKSPSTAPTNPIPTALATNATKDDKHEKASAPAEKAELEKLIVNPQPPPVAAVELTNVELETGKVVHVLPKSTDVTNNDENVKKDGAENGSKKQEEPEEPPKVFQDDTKQLRFYKVGYKQENIVCPLCGTRSGTKIIQPSYTCESLPGLLSLCSCCFPLLWTCCALNCVLGCLNPYFKTKRIFCRNCKGFLGVYTRPTV